MEVQRGEQPYQVPGVDPLFLQRGQASSQRQMINRCLASRPLYARREAAYLHPAAFFRCAILQLVRFRFHLHSYLRSSKKKDQPSSSSRGWARSFSTSKV